MQETREQINSHQPVKLQVANMLSHRVVSPNAPNAIEATPLKDQEAVVSVQEDTCEAVAVQVPPLQPEATNSSSSATEESMKLKIEGKSFERKD